MREDLNKLLKKNIEFQDYIFNLNDILSCEYKYRQDGFPLKGKIITLNSYEIINIVTKFANDSEIQSLVKYTKNENGLNPKNLKQLLKTLAVNIIKYGYLSNCIKTLDELKANKRTTK
ncbi:hypothetical protein BFS06_11745 [Clostridium perfringens]|uniref:Uncharacterized protein n=1 Tax=Clostridium perfringens TaxID=1502 RepID=A0A140GS60_CLOPF|nr:hypothetical protein [Clostridium perfringens]AMN31369.1 hypothetical protein JFP838_pA0453 [Clostridium perfringens]TBX14886.1 hypothetical protein BFS06_11745 [Clostridium perfringens]